MDFDKQKVTSNIKARHLCDDIGDVQHQCASPLTFYNIWTHNFLKIQIVSDKIWSIQKVVGLNYVVEIFFSWGCFGTQIHGLNFEF